MLFGNDLIPPSVVNGTIGAVILGIIGGVWKGVLVLLDRRDKRETGDKEDGAKKETNLSSYWESYAKRCDSKIAHLEDELARSGKRIGKLERLFEKMRVIIENQQDHLINAQVKVKLVDMSTLIIDEDTGEFMPLQNQKSEGGK